MPSSDPPLLRHVAANLRAARQQRGWTQQALAERADVSRRMVVGIEAGDSNVSLATLDRLADALGVPFADLVRAPDAAVPAPEVVWRGGDPRSRARFLAGVPGGGTVELWEWSLAPGERYDAAPDRPGTRTLVYVAAGTLTLHTDAGGQTVAEGESAGFTSDQPYVYANRGAVPLRVVITAVF
ncbi:MAG: XRE family transcriptional regulator [Longimicrobiaceae bacterium]